jgi:hypothetical protein
MRRSRLQYYFHSANLHSKILQPKVLQPRVPTRLPRAPEGASHRMIALNFIRADFTHSSYRTLDKEPSARCPSPGAFQNRNQPEVNPGPHQPFLVPARTIAAEASPSLESKALPLGWILDPAKGTSPTERILARLIQAETHEANPHFRDDIRQAFITVSFAAKGDTQPFVNASYRMYGLHPDKLYAAIEARKRAQLGTLYHEITHDEQQSAVALGCAGRVDEEPNADGTSRPAPRDLEILPPKKPAQSVTRTSDRRSA